MNTATASQTYHREGGTLRDAFAAVMRMMAQAAHRRRARRIASASLRGLSDMALKDIGMHRTEIGSVVHGTANERKRSNESA